MLHRLELREVGPAPELGIDFAPRLNLLTGDNGLGKSFLLDIGWWALTRTWVDPDQPAWPRPGDGGSSPRIKYEVQGAGPVIGFESVYSWQDQIWPQKGHRPPKPGLVLYMRVDGSFAVWDPARNYYRDAPSKGVSTPDRPDAFFFDRESVWKGLGPIEKSVCEGLERDWITWQSQKDAAFDDLCTALRRLSSDSGEILQPGKPMRMRLEDRRDTPTLQLSYGITPVPLASAGVKRMLALAYLMVWSWREHKEATRITRQEPTDRMVLLLDEVEAHLHPRWQRALLPSILELVKALARDVEVQLVVATHSPMVLASLETIFDESKDRLHHLVLEHTPKGHHARAVPIPWAKHGDVTNWLVSEVFGLKQARSVEAEKAVEAAEAFMRGAHAELPERLSTREAIDAELRRVLAGHDAFWPRWIVENPDLHLPSQRQKRSQRRSAAPAKRSARVAVDERPAPKKVARKKAVEKTPAHKKAVARKASMAGKDTSKSSARPGSRSLKSAGRRKA